MPLEKEHIINNDFTTKETDGSTSLENTDNSEETASDDKTNCFSNATRRIPEEMMSSTESKGVVGNTEHTTEEENDEDESKGLWENFVSILEKIDGEKIDTFFNKIIKSKYFKYVVIIFALLFAYVSKQ